MKRRATWSEKLSDSKGLPVVKKLDGKQSARWGSGTMVIPAPLEIDALMRQVPRGRVVTIQELRAAMAIRHGAAMCCPLTAGIFAWIAAHAGAEVAGKPERSANPWWRTLKTGGELNPKYPGGLALQARLLRAEGHRIVRKGARAFVSDHTAALHSLVAA